MENNMQLTTAIAKLSSNSTLKYILKGIENRDSDQYFILILIIALFTLVKGGKYQNVNKQMN
jgi:hypothetical protein